jgi:hypothetical protein
MQVYARRDTASTDATAAGAHAHEVSLDAYALKFTHPAFIC